MKPIYKIYNGIIYSFKNQTEWYNLLKQIPNFDLKAKRIKPPKEINEVILPNETDNISKPNREVI